MTRAQAGGSIGAPMETPLEIHWLFLAVALALLWFPRSMLRLGRWRKKRRKERETMVKFAQDGARMPDDKSVRLGREFSAPRNYVDLLRAGAGGFALWEFSFTAGPDDRQLILLVKIAITLVAVLIQSVRFRQQITFFAAIFFLFGLSLGMGNYVSGTLAFLLTCAINPLLPTPRLFVSAFALLLLPFNHFLGMGSMVLVAVNSMMLFVPVILSLLMHRPMVIFMKKHEVMW